MRRMIFLCRKWSVLLYAALLFPISSLAQQGQLTGAVRDPQNAAVVGAKVTATNEATQATATGRTNAEGEYAISGLAAGSYTLEINADGFKSTSFASIKVADSGQSVKNFALEVAPSSYSVTVNGLDLDTNPQTQQQASLLDLPEGLQADNVVFSAKDIQALHPSTLFDVLATLPGLEVGYQGRQHMDWGTVRGGNFAVILDGIYIAQIDRVLSSLPTQIVESMTVVRDSTALSIGPMISYHIMNTSGTGVSNQGFIIIRTKRSAKAEAGTVANGGSFATALGHAYIGSKAGNWDYRAAYTYSTSAGRDDWNMAYRNGSLLFHGGYSSPGLTMDFSYYGSRGMRNFEYGLVLIAKNSQCPTVAVGELCVNAMNMNRMNADLFAFNAVRHWNANNRTTLQYGFDRMYVDAGTAAAGSSLNSQDSTQANLSLKHTVLIKKNAITAGGQLIKYIAPNGQAPNMGYSYYRIDDAIVSWFVQDEYHALDNKLTLDGSVRSDLLHNNWSIPKSVKGTKDGSVDVWNPAYLTLSFGASYKLSSKLTTGARYGMVNSMPATNYVYMDASNKLSSDLPTQTQHRGELSAAYAYNSHVNVNVAVYGYGTLHTTTSATNCTGHSGSASWTDANGNEIDCVAITDIRTGGGELTLSGKIAGPFSYSTGYGYIGTDNATNNLSLSHNFVNTALDYRQKNWFAKYSMIYVGPKYASISPSATYNGKLADYSRDDLNGGYNFKLHDKPMTFTVFGRNLNNNLYATRYVSGAYRDPGRQWGVELATKLF